jgi:hypothetical protein
LGEQEIATLSHTLIHTSSLQKRFLKNLFAFLGFSEGLDHFLEKVGPNVCILWRETHVLKNGELLKKE